MSAPRSEEPDRTAIVAALGLLADVQDAPLSVQYARMWLREAKVAADMHTEARLLSRAEESIGRAIVASVHPSALLIQAHALTAEARREASN